MKFDDHEIWGAPAHAAEPAESQAAAAEPAASVSVSTGTLYRSAGSEAHPDAIVALPHRQRRHTTAQPVEATSWADTGLHAPITINSLLPSRSATPPVPARATAIDDPAIAEVLGASAAHPAEAPAGFTSWFRQATGFAPEPSPVDDNPSRTRSDRPASDARAPRARSLPQVSLGGAALSTRTAAMLAFALTTLVGIVNAKVSASLGAPTGIALVLATGAMAWMLAPSARRAAWVLPPYVLIAAVLVAGQFTANAPGASIIGQAILVVAALITLAPWLALSSILGVVLPLLRGRIDR